MIPLLDILTPIVNKVLDFIPDPAKKAEAQLAFQKEVDTNNQLLVSALMAIDKSQADIDLEEAKSPNIFIAGWRPFIGWTCAAAFAWAYVLRPVLCFGFIAAGHPLNMPPSDLGEMSGVLTGMLGLAGMRTYEKKYNIQDNH